MREFRKQWFAGNGDMSMARAYLLHKKLDKAFEHLNGMQQPPHPGESKENCDRFEEQYENAELEVGDSAKDIYCALTGNEVTRTRKA